MPLVKSKSPEAFRKNVKAEVQAGKPVKQAVAIAYSSSAKPNDNAYKRISACARKHVRCKKTAAKKK
jgi:hypothetical protein